MRSFSSGRIREWRNPTLTRPILLHLGGFSETRRIDFEHLELAPAIRALDHFSFHAVAGELHLTVTDRAFGHGKLSSSMEMQCRPCRLVM